MKNLDGIWHNAFTVFPERFSIERCGKTIFCSSLRGLKSQCPFSTQNKEPVKRFGVIINLTHRGNTFPGMGMVFPVFFGETP
jgi:hypothetical protein